MRKKISAAYHFKRTGSPPGTCFFLPLYTYGVEDKCIFSIIVIQKYVKKALEWRRETWQKSICAVRTRQRSFKPRSESDTLYPRSAFLTRLLPGMEVLSCLHLHSLTFIKIGTCLLPMFFYCLKIRCLYHNIAV